MNLCTQTTICGELLLLFGNVLLAALSARSTTAARRYKTDAERLVARLREDSLPPSQE